MCLENNATKSELLCWSKTFWVWLYQDFWTHVKFVEKNHLGLYKKTLIIINWILNFNLAGHLSWEVKSPRNFVHNCMNKRMQIIMYLSTKSSAGSTMEIPWWLEVNCSVSTAVVVTWRKIKYSLKTSNSFRNGRKKFFTGADVMLLQEQKQYNFTSVDMVVPWYYLDMIWQIMLLCITRK